MFEALEVLPFKSFKGLNIETLKQSKRLSMNSGEEINTLRCAFLQYQISSNFLMYVCVLTLESLRYSVLGEVSFCIRTLPNH